MTDDCRNLDRLYDVLERLSEKICCGTCGVCENDLIYLLDSEVRTFEKLNVPIIEIEGVYFLQKSAADDGFCPFRDRIKRSCTIYNMRPACCRLFPLEIRSEALNPFWALCLYCPKTSDETSNLKSIALSFLPDIEESLSQDLLDSFIKADKISRRIEVVLGVNSKAELLQAVRISSRRIRNEVPIRRESCKGALALRTLR